MSQKHITVTKYWIRHNSRWQIEQFKSCQVVGTLVRQVPKHVLSCHENPSRSFMFAEKPLSLSLLFLLFFFPPLLCLPKHAFDPKKENGGEQRNISERSRGAGDGLLGAPMNHFSADALVNLSSSLQFFLVIGVRFTDSEIELVDAGREATRAVHTVHSRRGGARPCLRRLLRTPPAAFPPFPADDLRLRQARPWVTLLYDPSYSDRFDRFLFSRDPKI